LSLSKRVSSLLFRLVLLVAVAAGTGVLVGFQILPAAVGLTEAVSAFEQQVLDVPPLPSQEFQPENSFIYASDGAEIAEIAFEQRRIPVTLDQIPTVVENAVIATEDADFWEHNGINYKAIVRAALANAQAGETEQGGSTITQQYVENAYLPVGERFDTVGGKVTEAIWSIELERRVSKSEILEGYLNRVYLGNGVYGFGTAAEYYFNKDIEDLDLGEAAVLAGMIRSPEGNEPIDNPANARGRRDIVLDQMVLHGYATQEQADAAKARSIDSMLDITEATAFDYPFWVDWVTRLLVSEPAAEGLGTQLRALEAMGATDEERVQTVFQSGLRIHTTLNPRWQALAEQAVGEFLTEPGTDPMGGIISVEPGTGAIRTMAVGPKPYGECDPGEAGIDDRGRLLCTHTKFNPLIPADAGSTRSGRQPGSAFKPFVISAALEQGIPPGWQIEATGPQTIPGCDNGGDWTVNNSGGNGFRDMYSGVAGSSNVFHARLIKEVGPANVVTMAQRLGIRRSDLPAVCALALGAVEVFPLEMATAYATLANRGEYCAPYAIERIEDSAGNVIFQQAPDCQQVVDSAIADRVVDIMQGPVNAGGTAPIANLAPYPTRGKTGTTNDYIDAWFVGYVAQLATASWIGYENGLTEFETAEQARAACRLPASTEFSGRIRCAERRLMRNVSVGGQSYSRVFGGTIPAPMWKAYMVEVVSDFEPRAFPLPGPQPGTIVPDITVFETVTEVEQALAAARLNLILTEVDDFRPAGTFVGQAPAAGESVIAGRSVQLLISNGQGVTPVVPDVVGLPQAEAIATIHAAGYDVGRVTKVVEDPERIGIVLAQSPRGGEELAPEEGTLVVIQVGVAEGSGDGDVEAVPKPDSTPSPTPSPTTSDQPPTDEETPAGGGNSGNGNGGGRPSDGGGGERHLAAVSLFAVVPEFLRRRRR